MRRRRRRRTSDSHLHHLKNSREKILKAGALTGRHPSTASARVAGKPHRTVTLQSCEGVDPTCRRSREDAMPPCPMPSAIEPPEEPPELPPFTKRAARSSDLGPDAAPW